MNAGRNTGLRNATARLRHAQGGQMFSLDLFGDYLAEREGYREHDGADAVRYFLMCKHGWLPRDVQSMSGDDLLFAIAEDMAGWVMPVDTRNLYPSM